MESHIDEMSPSELSAKKTKDYRNILIFQCFIILIYFTLEDFLQLFGWSAAIQYKNFVFLAAAGAYFLLLWDIMRNFVTNKWLINGTLALLLLDYLLGILGENPLWPLLAHAQPYYFFIHFTLMIIEWFVIGLVIRDLFTGAQATRDKLWCSACLYITIGITFGSMYDLLNIIQPDGFGKSIPPGFSSYIEGIYFSFSILGSGTVPYATASHLHRSLGVMQAVWANLYLVLLIGRLLVLPEKTKR